MDEQTIFLVKFGFMGKVKGNKNLKKIYHLTTKQWDGSNVFDRYRMLAVIWRALSGLVFATIFSWYFSSLQPILLKYLTTFI